MVPVTVLEELACFFFSIAYLRKEKAGYWRYFIPFMGITCLIEITGWILSLEFPKQHNHWLYNVEMLIEFSFISLVFSEILHPLFNSKIWIITGIAIFGVSYIVESIYRKFVIYNYFSDSLAAVLFVIGACSYLYFLIRRDDYINLYRHAPFWLVAGILLFYLGSTAVNLFFEDLMKLNIVRGIPLRLIIFPVLNAILYGCWIYAFRCKYRQDISSH